MKHHLCIISSDSNLKNSITKAFKPLGIEVDHLIPARLLKGEVEKSAKITLVDLESFDDLPHAVWENLRKSLEHTFYIPLLARANNTVHRKWFGNPVKTLSKPLTSGQLRWLVFQCVRRSPNPTERTNNASLSHSPKSPLVNTLQAVLRHQHREAFDNQSRVTNLIDFVAKEYRLDPLINESISAAARLYELGALLDDSSENSRKIKSVKRRRMFHSAAIAKVSGAQRNVVQTLRNTDENWDGTGLPAGKKGKAIPIGARILRIAIDFIKLQYDSELGLFLTTNEALAWLRDASDRLYDPSLVNAFFDYLLACRTNGDRLTLWICGARNLQPGMTLSEDLYGRSGLMLLSKGKILNEHLVSRLIDYEERFFLRDGLFAGVFDVSQTEIRDAN